MSAQANRKSKITKFLYDLYGNQHKTQTMQQKWNLGADMRFQLLCFCQVGLNHTFPFQCWDERNHERQKYLPPCFIHFTSCVFAKGANRAACCLSNKCCLFYFSVNCFQRVCCLKNKEETLYFFLPLNELFKTHLASRSKCASEINGAQLNLAIVGFKTSLFI